MRCVAFLAAACLTLVVFAGGGRADQNSAGGTPSPAVASPGVEATPTALGFPVPNPEPPLPEGADPFNPPVFPVDDAAPAIAEISRTADRDEIVSMTGVDLGGATSFDIFAQAPSAAAGSVVSTKALVADEAAATVLMPASLPAWSMYLVWPRRGDAHGRPFAINRTEAWWIGPDKAVAGETIAVYGRNLSRSNGTSSSSIYIKPAGGTGQFVTPVAVNPFKVDFRIPDLAPGTYEVWVHNGHGGRFGWSGPLQLGVLDRSPWADQDKRVVEAKSFGAVGDGTADDTQAIRLALAAAGKAAPATVHFPAGTYRVTAELSAPNDVRWLGDGMDLSTIRLDKPVSGNMIDAADRNGQFERLTLDANGQTGTRALLQLSDISGLRIESARLRAWGAPATEASRASDIYVNASELIENGSFYGASRQVFMTGNRFRMTGNGESVAALWGGRDFAMVGNDLANADESRDDGHGVGRFFVAQAHFGSMKNLYWGNNVSHDAAPNDCDKVDCNKGEQICFEIVGGDVRDDFVGATQDSITFRSLVAPSPQDRPGGHDVVVIGGRGAGQYRHILSVSNGKATLDRPWNVVPDASSRFAVASIASQAVVYDNSFEGRATYSEHDSNSTGVLLWGSVYDVVVDSNRISRMRHGMMTVAPLAPGGFYPYFLQYSRNTVTDSNSGLYIGVAFSDAVASGTWGGLGNIYRKNSFENLAHIGVEYEGWDYAGADFNGTVFEGNSFTDLPYGFIDGYKLLWTYDGRFKIPPPYSSKKINTVLYRNTFERGSAPLAGSIGFRTRQPANSWLDVDTSWSGFATGNDGPQADQSVDGSPVQAR
ncbi:glycosyl hydrolase family 28-related protein [Rhizobium sp. BK251]|uniref:glycosyl hydrolase family 28-related protein n=1 Tax=Rhizobium sp. BK251 TaxID=2512125 RepID=UPI00104743BA|nr:glycosyl hydrolase family 28-related protein [Rhizobium sp. BK251]TCL70340.1 polygalacturonase [Rhizobium sp. BK251]